MSFPAHFPDECPPSSAEDARGEVYIFVRNEPPVAADFLSYFTKGRPYQPEKKCEACGLSVLRTEQDVREARRLCSWFRKRKVAQSAVVSRLGKNGANGKQERSETITHGGFLKGSSRIHFLT